MRWTAAFAVLVLTAAPAAASPTVFWVSEPVRPGAVVLLYGGELGKVREVSVWRLADEEAGMPPPRGSGPRVQRALRVRALQPSDGSLKFVLPAGLKNGIFAVDPGGEPKLINAPRVEWGQPTRLLPGLNENEAAPGSEVQLIGRNFLPEGGAPERVKAVLRGRNGEPLKLRVARAEKYSLIVALPRDLPPGEYEVWVHNGHGGPLGWGSGLRLTVKQPTRWPETVFNVKDFGAKGDNITDDSSVLRKALAAAERNGGGVIYFPRGTYRLTGWFHLPKRVILRGEGKDIAWLKWPQTQPKSAADFIPAVLYGAGEYGLENLSLMARNARTVLRDLSFDALHRLQAQVPEMTSFMPLPGQARDVFLRHVRIHYLPYAGRPGRDPQQDAQWQFSQWGITNSSNHDLTVAVGGIRNIEVSDSEFVGTQRFLDCQNARFVGNHFSNQMGVSWTDLGGQYIILEGNRIFGASSWRSAWLPLRHLYVAHNFSRNIGRGEREALTFDVNGILGKTGKPPVKPWQGKTALGLGKTLRLQEPAFRPGIYRGFDVQILRGKGAGQYRAVEDNTEDTVTVSKPWDVPPDETSVVLIHRLSGHVIFYGNTAEDTSVLGQIWGHLYDAVFDGNKVLRSQGMWGLAGWFVQWLNNRLDVAVTYHSGIGPAGSPADKTPEGGAGYGYMGFTIGGRVTTELTMPFAYVRGSVVRGNRLSYNQRVLVMWGYGGERRRVNFVAARDIVIDHNQIEHTPVGIELDANVEGAVVAHNTFADVKEPLRLHDPERVLVLDANSES